MQRRVRYHQCRHRGQIRDRDLIDPEEVALCRESTPPPRVDLLPPRLIEYLLEHGHRDASGPLSRVVTRQSYLNHNEYIAIINHPGCAQYISRARTPIQTVARESQNPGDAMDPNTTRIP